MGWGGVVGFFVFFSTPLTARVYIEGLLIGDEKYRGTGTESRTSKMSFSKRSSLSQMANYCGSRVGTESCLQA